MKTTSVLALLMCFLFGACHTNIFPVIPPRGIFDLTITNEQGTVLTTKAGEASFSNRNNPGQTQIVLNNPDFRSQQQRGHSNVFADIVLTSLSTVSEPSIIIGDKTTAVITQNFFQTPGDWQYLANNGNLTITSVAPNQMVGTFDYRFTSNGTYTFNSTWGRNIRITGSFTAVCLNRCN